MYTADCTSSCIQKKRTPRLEKSSTQTRSCQNRGSLCQHINKCRFWGGEQSLSLTNIGSLQQGKDKRLMCCGMSPLSGTSFPFLHHGSDDSKIRHCATWHMSYELELMSYPAVVGTECRMKLVTEKEGETWRGDFHILWWDVIDLSNITRALLPRVRDVQGDF